MGAPCRTPTPTNNETTDLRTVAGRDSSTAEESDRTDVGPSGCDAGDCANQECTQTNGGTEICDGKDNDCDGTVDENAVLLHEGFEREDALASLNDWSKNAEREFLNVDSDVVSESAPQGKEFAKAFYKHGSCTIPGGLAGGKSFGRDIDRISVRVDVEIDAWGRAAIWILDQAPPGGGQKLTKIWAANAKGDGFTTNGWKKLVFDESSSDERTTASGAIVEQKALPSDLAKSSVVFIFGNDDDTQYCEIGDHGWTMRLDDLRVVDRCG